MPPWYPTAVVTTPGTCQKIRSAPQKQPIATYSTCVPSGQGPFSGVPRTACVAGTGYGVVARPGRASSGEIMRVLNVEPNTTGYLQNRVLHRLNPAEPPRHPARTRRSSGAVVGV